MDTAPIRGDLRDAWQQTITVGNERFLLGIILEIDEYDVVDGGLLGSAARGCQGGGYKQRRDDLECVSVHMGQCMSPATIATTWPSEACKAGVQIASQRLLRWRP
jgi:hypothetical protein